uniref:Uncharacterized protein n=1 Tax=Astyanax mexicanus TaxID=7994 RepID=A0A3B1K679_ASTMX
MCVWRPLRAWMTSPRASSERLMFWASFRRSPSAPDFHTRSEPARSTRFSLPTTQRVTLSTKNKYTPHSSADLLLYYRIFSWDLWGILKYLIFSSVIKYL